MLTGHGCPADQLPRCCAARERSLSFEIVRTQLTKLASVLVAVLLASFANAQRVECEFRFVWDASTAVDVESRIRLGEGFIRPVRNLSFAPQSIGAMQTTSPRELAIRSSGAGTFGGVDFQITASMDTIVTIECVPQDAPDNKFEHRVAVRDLLQQTWIERVEPLGIRVAIERQVGDKIRFDSHAKSSIFAPGEVWPLSVSGYRTGLPAGTYELEMAFGDRIEESFEIVLDQDGSFSSRQTEVRVPESHGGHLLEIRLNRWSAIPSLLARTPALVRRCDIAVFSEDAASKKLTGWRQLATIDAFQASQTGTLAWLAPEEVTRFVPSIANDFANRIAPYNPLAGTLTTPNKQGETRARTVESSEPPEQCLVLAPGSWISVPLSGLTAGLPHRLRVRYPSDKPMQLAVSVRPLQDDNYGPNARSFESSSFESKVVLKPRQCGPEPEGLYHELVFWPRQQRQEVLLLNSSSQTDASVFNVEIDAAEMQANSTASQPSENRKRSVAVSFNSPHLVDAFAALRPGDRSIDRNHEGWSTWTEVAMRMVDISQALGAGSVVIPVVQGGAALQPSDSLAPTSRLQSSTFYTDSRSPELKDATELILRHLDSAGVNATLSLAIDAPIPAIETLARTSQSEDLTQTLSLSVSGDSSEGRGESSGGPQYNPLARSVKQHLQRCLEEIIRRYGHHKSFSGIQIHLTPESHFVFRGATWGYDDSSLQAFQKDVGGTLDLSKPLSEVFSQPALRRSYLQWRAEQTTDWIVSVANSLRSQAPDVDFVVNLDQLVAQGSISQPTDQAGSANALSNADMLLAHGIALDRLRQADVITLVMGSTLLPQDNDRAARKGQNVRGGAQNTLVIKHATESHTIPASASAAASRIFPVVHAAGRYDLQQITEQLYLQDANQIALDGWTPRIGNLDILSEFAATFSALPDVEMTDVAVTQYDSGLRIRTGRTRDRTYIQIVNSNPWPERLQIGLSSTNVDSAHLFGTGKTPRSIAISDRGTTDIQLRPFDLQVIEIADPKAVLSGTSHQSAANTLTKIDSELSRMQELITRAGDPTYFQELSSIGGDFETWNESGVPASWNVSSLPQAAISQSKKFPRSGTSSSLIVNSGSDATSAWMQSQQFLPPRTRRLLISTWLRSSPSSPPMRARVSVSGRLNNGELYFQATEVGAKSSSGTRIPVDWGRRPVQLFVSEVPSQELRSLKVGIELLGRGKLWVDDVEVFEMVLQPDEQNYLRGRLLVARKHLAEGNAYVAEQLLGGAWGEYLAQHSETFVRRDSRLTSLEGPRGDSARGASWNNTPPILKRWRAAVEQRLRR